MLEMVQCVHQLFFRLLVGLKQLLGEFREQLIL